MIRSLPALIQPAAEALPYFCPLLPPKLLVVPQSVMTAPSKSHSWKFFTGKRPA